MIAPIQTGSLIFPKRPGFRRCAEKKNLDVIRGPLKNGLFQCEEIENVSQTPNRYCRVLYLGSGPG